MIYNLNPSKAWLVVNRTVEEKAREIFGENILAASLEVKVDAANTLRNW